MRPIGIFGGTFDPIHYGHLRTALELKQRARPRRACISCRVANPPHRTTPMTDGALRLRMVEAAIRGEPGFVADDRELKRAGLVVHDRHARELSRRSSSRSAVVPAARHGRVPRATRSGTAGASCSTLAHVVVAHRPGWEAPRVGVLGDLVARAVRRAPRELATRPAGFVHVQPVTQLEISSTDLRDTLRARSRPEVPGAR